MRMGRCHSVALCRQLQYGAAIPAVVPACDTLCGRASTTPVPVLPTPVLLPRRGPRKGMGAPSKGYTDADWTRTPIGATPRNHFRTSTEPSRRPQEPELAVNSPRRLRIREDDDPARCHAHQCTIVVGFTYALACNCPSLTYKRKGQTPSYGKIRIHTAIAHTPTPALSPRYWHFASISLAFRDLEASSPLPPCL